MWKYVSPKRRRIGLFFLALMLICLYAGWYFTNDAFIRREAKKALENLTSGEVEINKAEFSVFEGIRLEGVEVRLKDDKSPKPFFYASKVVLKHNPLALFLRRRIEVTEIKCIQPEVNVEYDNQAGISNAEKLFRQASKGKATGSGAPFPLPSIYLVDGKLRPIVKDGPRYSTRDTEDRGTWKCSLIPISDIVYQVTLERKQDNAEKDKRESADNDDAIWARLELNTVTGQITTLEGAATDQLFNLLPPKYQKWIDRYKPRGEFQAIEGADTKPDEGKYKIELRDFSLELPPEEGGLTLADVHGFLLFTREGVKMQDVTGKVIQAGKAEFRLNGTYLGYDKKSPFSLEVDIRNLHLPEKATGTLENPVEFVRQRFQPEGSADVSLKYNRDENGRQSGKGVVKLNDISVVPEFFPLPMQKVRGNIYFTAAGIQSIDLTAWPNKSTFNNSQMFKVSGTFAMVGGYQTYDVTVEGTDIALDDAFRNALKEKYQNVWDMINPSGRTNGRYRVIDPGRTEKNIYELDVDMQGYASGRCTWFPYPLKNIYGKIHLKDNTVTIDNLQSQSGEAICNIRGQIENINTPKPDINLSILAKRVPLDKTLRESFKGKAREWIESLNVSGLASRVEAVIKRTQADENINFDITASVKNVSYMYDKFPYRVNNAEGRLRITRDSIAVDNISNRKAVKEMLARRQGKTDETQPDTIVEVSGKILTAGEQPRLDLYFAGENIRLDDKFSQALSEKTRKVWDSLTPSGMADMNIELKTIGQEPDTELSYHFTLHARDMSIKYEAFPYAFHGVTGTAEVWPGRVRLENMKATHGKMKASINGEILTGEKGDDVTISISAKDIPFDKEFLAAIPQDILPLSERFKPGGKCNAEITRLTFHRDPQPTTAPAGKTPPPKVTWSIEGGLGFRDVSLDIGFGPRKLTGMMQGKAAQAGSGLSVAADCQLESLELKKYVITDIKGQLSKNEESKVLQLDNIVARALEGRLAGDATIILTEPMSYKLNASVENINVSELVNAGVPPEKRQTNVNGRLTGQIFLEATAGKKPTRQAVGELEISRANMYKMPVILGLLNVIYLSVPSETAFNSGFIRYHLKNDTLLLKEIYLTGVPENGVSKGISVLGSGRMNMKTDDLNLTFLTGPPGELPRLDNVVVELLQALSKELVEIRVTGTLKEPKMTTHHLRSLETIMKRIIEPSLKTE